MMRGWEACSADLLPSESEPGTYRSEDGRRIGYSYHYQGDVRDLFNWNHEFNRRRAELNHIAKVWDPAPPLWDLVIAHPPCTDLSYAGARWFKEKQANGQQQSAADFFMEMLDAPSPYIAVENPHSIMQKLYQPPTQSIQPWMFGNPFIKRTDLWLRNLPVLVPVYKEHDFPQLFRATTGGGSWRTDKNAAQQAMSAYEDSEGRKNRAKVRSRTFPGIASAFATQWGDYVEVNRATI